MHNVAVQGPHSREMLSTIVWTPRHAARFAELGWFRFCIGRLGDSNGVPVVVSRTGYTGELGYEVLCHPRDAVAVCDAVWEAGQPHGLRPLGLEALDMLRIEAGLVFGGYDFSDQTDPFEAGIGFTVPLKTKDDDFIGRDALLVAQGEPAAHAGRPRDGGQRAGRAMATASTVGRAQVGVVTSATRSPLLGKNIALCRLSVQFADLGTELEVGKLDGQQKRIPAQRRPVPVLRPGQDASAFLTAAPSSHHPWRHECHVLP